MRIIEPAEYCMPKYFVKSNYVYRNITVSSSTKYEMPRLLNYLTAPNVLVWSAVTASCAIPFVYKSAPLMARDKQGNILPWNPSGHRYSYLIEI